MFSRLITFARRKLSRQYNFDLQYANHKWDDLNSLAELGRYNIIVGLSRYFCPGGRILDLGCGEGVLQEKFTPADYLHYTGVDFSQVAIGRAASKGFANTTYTVADLNKLDIAGTFDVIIYNESIYYLDDPVAAVKRLIPHLAPGGVFIISQVDKHGHEDTAMWQLLESVLELKDRTKVTNIKGHSWTIHVYQPASK
jgi:2-polyprenyl-3-methyl-5-hydroxy-6-metoxy-1,4-benzoquinol methylase